MAGKYSAETIGMGIRITKAQREALERIATKTGVEVSQLIRFAIDALLEHYERCGGRLVLPIDFDELVSIEQRSAAAVTESGAKSKTDVTPGDVAMEVEKSYQESARRTQRAKRE